MHWKATSLIAPPCWTSLWCGYRESAILPTTLPCNATLVYVLKLYREAFEYHKMGYASAMAWVLFLVLLALTLVVVKTSKSWVHYEGLK